MKSCMSTLSLVLLLVAVSTARHPGKPGGPGGPGKHHGPENGDHAVCKTALKPSDTEIQALKDAITVCIGEQDGLDAIIATLKGPRGDDNDGDRPGRHSRRRGPPKHRGPHDLAERLEEAQHTTQATTLRECTARETGLLNADGTFNDEAHQTELKAKVSGATVEENTLKGIENCGTVQDYNISGYMRCIRSYCATGSSPPPA